MSFLHNSLTRAWWPKKSSDILPGRDGQNHRRVQRDSVTSIHPEHLELPSTKSDVLDENRSPTVQKVASSAILSISNTLRSKARMFYVDSVKAEMNMSENTAAKTSAIQPSSRSYTNASSLGDGHKEQGNFSKPTTSVGDSREKNQKFLELTASSSWKYKDTLPGSNANSLKWLPLDDVCLDDELSTYIEPFNPAFSHARDLDLTIEDDFIPRPCDARVTSEESSDYEGFRFGSSRHAFEYKHPDFGFYKGDDSRATNRGPWDLKHSESSNSTYRTYDLSELSGNSSTSMSHEGDALAVSYKAYQAHVPDSDGSSSSCSGSLSAEAKCSLVETPSTSPGQYLITKTIEDIDTNSEHESDHMAELARFPNYLKDRVTEHGEVGCETESPLIETKSTGQDRYNSERPFNTAKLPKFNAPLPENHVALPSVQADSNCWVLPPLAILHPGNINGTAGFNDCEGFDETATLNDLNPMMDFIPSAQLSREDV